MRLLQRVAFLVKLLIQKGVKNNNSFSISEIAFPSKEEGVMLFCKLPEARRNRGDSEAYSSPPPSPLKFVAITDLLPIDN